MQGPKGGPGAGKGGKGKEQRECWNCGKVGHLSSDCWGKPKGGGKDPGGKGGKTKTKGAPWSGRGAKGYPKGRGNDTHALDADAEPEAEVGAFDFDVCHFATGANLVVPDEEGWLSVNLDTGAAASVWPAEANYGSMMPMPEKAPHLHDCDWRVRQWRWAHEGERRGRVGPTPWASRLARSCVKASAFSRRCGDAR